MGKQWLDTFGEEDAEDGEVCFYIYDRRQSDQPYHSLTNLTAASSKKSKASSTSRNCSILHSSIKTQDGTLSNRPRNRGLRAAKKRQPEPPRSNQSQT